jgi:hypothetical protein
VQGVVEVVAPLHGHAEAAAAGRFDHARVVQVALGNERQRAAEPLGERGRLVRQLSQEMSR